ncbi:MAG: hypothetical protein CMG62_08150 [Candidatus Marinimicrobia bacterium]|nr:hypothetical protein [Candidatus Neomarinimicrobiota bacterium]
MIAILALFIGLVWGHIIKHAINWLEVDEFTLEKSNPVLEIFCGIFFTWSFSTLNLPDAIIFSLISSTLCAIAIVDLFTMQIPLLFILDSLFVLMVSILLGYITWPSALWGIFVGAGIPGLIMGMTYLITKRQGMGYGDLQLGIILGIWLGPLRMGLTLFMASLLSLLAWITISIFKGFDTNRALPFAPFLSVSGIGLYIVSFYYPGLFQLAFLG